MNAREQLALSLRREGKTYASIAGVLGVSAHRASQICKKADRVEAAEKLRAETGKDDLLDFPDSMSLVSMLNSERFSAFLSGRTFNCLNNQVSASFGNTFHTIGDVRRATDEHLLRIPNFGRKSLTEVRRVLG